MGAPAGARRARRRRRRARARPAPAGAEPGGARRARPEAARRPAAPAAARRARRHRGDLRAVRGAVAAADLPALGRVGGADARARAQAAASPYDLVHAHYAAPAGDAVRRARPGRADRRVRARRRRAVGGRPPGRPRRSCEDALRSATLVLANSTGIEAKARELGATSTRVVHLGTDLPPEPTPEPAAPTIATVAHLVARKRHVDVLRALATLDGGPAGSSSATALSGPLLAAPRGGARASTVEFKGQLPPEQAHRPATVFALPSVDEAFGVAYIEAMARGHPGHRLRGRGRAGGDRGVRRRDGARRRRATRRRSPARSRALIENACRRELGERRARDRRGATSRGRRAGTRPSPPTRRRCAGEARSCSSPTTRRRSASARSRRCTSART